MAFRRAEEKDVKEIAGLYDAVCDFLEEHENYPGWKKGIYPTDEDAIAGIKDGALYVVTEQDQIAGTMMLRHKPEEEYKNIKWLTDDDYEKIYIVYTLAVHPHYIGKGIGEKLLSYAEQIAKKENCVSLRLDVVKGNLPAENLYKRCGYQFLGTTSLGHEEYGLPWYNLYEKVLEADDSKEQGGRPSLEKGLDGKTFRSFYYLKEELVDFCRQNGIPTTGGKVEITDRIAHFLDTGEIPLVPVKTRKKASIANITTDTRIEQNFVCSETHRALFKEQIGKSFSFNVAFQKWLKSNAGKTYAEAITAYYQILEDKKKKKTVIDKQFEYNTYIRDFFADNQGKSLEEAIKCWKYKKQLQGHNRYEKTDLTVLEK